MAEKKKKFKYGKGVSKEEFKRWQKAVREEQEFFNRRLAERRIKKDD